MIELIGGTKICRLFGGFHARLKTRTQPFHDRLESRLPLLNPYLTVEAYCTLLKQFYGFYRPLEAVFARAATGLLQGEVDRRRKVQWLVQDLMALGETTESIAGLPLCTTLPRVTTQARLMGSLYVVEGATLGGQMVRRFLQQSLDEQASGCCRFFLSYGEQVRPQWEAFLQSLAEAAEEPEHQGEIIESACETFLCFEQWLSNT